MFVCTLVRIFRMCLYPRLGCSMLKLMVQTEIMGISGSAGMKADVWHHVPPLWGAGK